MDPRHPELAVSRMRELMKQYDRIEKDMGSATTSAKLAELEREGGLVVQEICLVAPRIHEAMMQTSRQRRSDIAHGLVSTMGEYDYADIVDSEKVKEAIEYLEQSTFEQPESEPAEPKPKKKKKTTKKAEK